MPTLTGPDGSPYKPTAPAPTAPAREPAPTTAISEGSASAATTAKKKSDSNPMNNDAKNPPPNDNNASTSRRAMAMAPNDGNPAPPDSAPKVQLGMWLQILKRRRRQMNTLSNEYFSSFANDVVSDFISSKYEKNEYSKERKGKGSNSNNSNKENRKDGTMMKIDLSAGHYSQYLLREQQQQPPLPSTTLTAHDIGIHLLALFYRSVDDRLSSAMRKHGLDTVRKAFQRLEFWMSKCEKEGKNGSSKSIKPGKAGVTSGKKKRKKRKSQDSSERDGNSKDRQIEPRRESSSQRSDGREDGSNKRMRKDPPELSSEGDGKNKMMGNKSDNISHRSNGSEDASNKSMRKTPPELGRHLGMAASGTGRRPGIVQLPPQPESESDSTNNSDQEKSPYEGEGKDNLHTSDASGDESNNAKTSSLPKNQEELNRDINDKGKGRPGKLSECDDSMAASGSANDSTENNARTDNRSQRSGMGEDGSNKRTRKDPPELSDKLGVGAIGTSQRRGKVFLPPNRRGKMFLPPRLQGDSVSTENSEGEKSSLNGKQRNTPDVSQVPRNEPSGQKASQNQQGQNTGDVAKSGEVSDKSVPNTSAQKMNRKDAGSAQQGSDMVTQQKPQDVLDDSRKGERKDSRQPKQRNAGFSKAFGSQQRGKRFEPLKAQLEKNMKLSEKHRTTSTQSASQMSNHSNDPAAYQQGLNDLHDNSQRKEPPQLKMANADTSKESEVEQSISRTAALPTQTSQPQGRMENALRKEKPSDPSSNNLASQKANTKDFEPRKRRAVTMTDERQDISKQSTQAAISSNDTTARPSNANAAASEKQTVRDPFPISVNKNKDANNASHSANKAASEAARSSEPQNELRPASIAQNAKTGNGQNFDDVIDLTEDSPSDEWPSPPDEALNAHSTAHQAIKQNDEENTEPPPPSPPASPPPPIIHNPSPPPRPSPKPFSKMQTTLFIADPVPTRSGSLAGRHSCGVSYDAGYHLDGSGTCMDDTTCIDVKTRLLQWDPFWKIVEELGAHNVISAPSKGRRDILTSVGTRTTSCVSSMDGPSNPEQPSSCATVFIDLPKEVLRSKLSNRDSSGKLLAAGYRPWGVKWGKLSHPYTDDKDRMRDRTQTGDRRLVVRTLPLQRTSKDIKKRADGHLWPKGAFLQLKQGRTVKVLSLSQRKQQSHDHNEWKGMSHALDLTKEVIDTKVPIELKLCSKEVVENVNGTLMGSYALHAAICEYVEPDDLYNQLMGKDAGGDVTIPRISLGSARKMAKKHLADSMVSIIDSDDEDSSAKSDQGKNLDSTSLTFSLLCNMSKQAMETPVRGRHCKHMQCFDLRNFLYTNKNITGGRWRCGVCESFVNVRDLVHCGLFQAMLDALGGQVSGARDRVSYRADGTWKLMDENRLRYGSKRGGSNAAKSSTVGANNARSGNKRSAFEQEVIELL